MKDDKKNKIVNRIDKAALFFFAVLVFFLPISNAIVESAFGFVFLCFLLRVLFRKPTLAGTKIFFKKRINWVLLVFYLLIGFSVLMSNLPPRVTFRPWITRWGEGILLFYLAQVFLNKKRVKILLFVFLSALFLHSLNGIYQVQAGTGFIRGFSAILSSSHGFLAARSTFHHYNNFATYLGVGFFIALSFFLYYQSYKLKLTFALLSVLVVINLFFTHSRGGLLAFFLAVFFILLIFPDKKIKASGFFILLLLLSFIFFSSLGRDFLSGLAARSDAGRLKIWKEGFLLIRESPIFGFGLGSWGELTSRVGYAHNNYVQILFESGLLGLLSFLWFLGELLWGCFKKIRRNFDVISLGLLTAIIVFLIHSFFDVQFYSLKLRILFWLMAGLAVAYSGQEAFRSAESNFNKT